MGLIPYLETEQAEKAVEWARSAVEKNLDLETVWRIAHETPLLNPVERSGEEKDTDKSKWEPLRIGFIRDHSFWFYYPENLKALENRGGARLVEINSLQDSEIPLLDALYIGGGFPETQAQALADNVRFRESLKEAIDEGLPVYAECGGLMYLGRDLIVNDNSYPMVGALPIRFKLEKRPQGHGYTILETAMDNPYYQKGEVIKGHEFHYSRPILMDSDNIKPVFKVLRGCGLDGQRDGLCRKNLLATYTHIHAAGNKIWAGRLCRTASAYKNLKSDKKKD
jgi:cobyrinic acid a,c-diamide synthase